MSERCLYVVYLLTIVPTSVPMPHVRSVITTGIAPPSTPLMTTDIPALFMPIYLTRSTTFTVKLSKASLASLSGNCRINPRASPANCRASSIVLSSPRPF